MSLLTVLHATMAGLLLAAAAGCGEWGLRRLGLPARWIWVVALGATLAVPFGLPSPGGFLTGLASGGHAGALDGILLGAPGPAPGASAEPPPATVLNRARPWIPGVWLALALAGVGALAGGLHRLERRARSWPSARVAGEPILVSSDFGPAVLGLRRSRTVLPRWALSLPARELELVLRHEGAHRRARDPQLLAVGVLMAALAPWNPAVWLCVGRLREAVEKDCDRRVLRGGVDRFAYARTLVSLRGRLNRSGLSGPPFVPALVEPPSSLERRLRTMWILPSPRRAVPALLGAVALVVAACESPSPTVSPPEPAQDLSVSAAGALVEVESTADQPEPLIVVDGEVHEGTLAVLTPEDIERIEVLRGAAAEALYGAAGAHGVVEITTRAAGGAAPDDEAAGSEAGGTVRIRARPSTGVFRVDSLPEGSAGVLRELDARALDGALVFVDGVEAPGGLPSGLRPEEIDRVEVVKGEAAARLHGPRAAAGVIRITTKRQNGGGS